MVAFDFEVAPTTSPKKRRHKHHYPYDYYYHWRRDQFEAAPALQIAVGGIRNQESGIKSKFMASKANVLAIEKIKAGYMCFSNFKAAVTFCKATFVFEASRKSEQPVCQRDYAESKRSDDDCLS